MLIRQEVKKNYRSNDVIMTTADALIFTGLLAGMVSTYEQRSTGGVDIMTVPEYLRGMKFGVSRRVDGLSCTVSFKHVKATKHANDIFAHQALFDADYVTTLGATKLNMIYQGAKA